MGSENHFRRWTTTSLLPYGLRCLDFLNKDQSPVSGTTINFKFPATSDMTASEFLESEYPDNDSVLALERQWKPDTDSRFACPEDEEWCLEEPNPRTSEIQAKIQGAKAAMSFIKQSPDLQSDR